MTTRVTSPHDTFELNNGVRIPVIGLGVFQTPPERTVQAVQAALQAGYRHIDTAAAYRNEREVGEGIRRSGIPREDVFVETKIWVSDYGHDQTLHAFEKATAKLGFDTIDLLLLHQPAVGAFDRTIGAYRALEKLLADGQVRAIGVSNFTPAVLDRLLAEVDVVPAVNQIELHPYFTQAATQRADAEHGILTQAWSPIGGITFYGGYDGPGKSTLTDPTLREIADRCGKTPAQAMLRWHLQQGRSAIPKSTNPARIAENTDIFDFALGREDLAAIDALDTGVRSGPDPEQPQPQFFEFRIPEA
ncbi:MULTISPECIES: aldo/keto reductase [Amycolatopsis]|uniref:Oxidoreductase n=1 Tax=Amycolatopsis bullii TaxID=941987 RepID=A0ABQ3JZY7_9PSEU|nr:aldo/keto reductase [Amycolatopsis bullii]GHF93335.1 oxidoreductase [Amycolatopsis bullii]